MFALGVSFLLIVLSSREELGLGHNVAATADATLVGTSGASSFNSILEDDIQFLFKWPGESLLHLENDLKENARQKVEFVEIRSGNNEKYRCTIPMTSTDSQDENKSKKESDDSNQERINTSGLLENIYSRKLCSYRIESYWIYELCHGQFIKQYHETKSSGKRLITNEYFLGYFDPTKQEPDYLKKNDNDMMPNVHWRSYAGQGGQKVPMFAVRYTDGTPCDILSNIPRETTVYYACDETGNDNIVGFEEISSCVYEMVVVTKWICSHPAYRLPEKAYNSISCYSMEDSPLKPKILADIENEQAISRGEGNRVKLTDNQGSTFIVHYKTIDDDDTLDEDLNENLDSNNASPDQPSGQNQQPTNPNQQQQPPTSQQALPQHQQQQPHNQPPIIGDDAQKEMINAFISGVQCLHGGAGWWKYEVCLGKKVVQYHEDEKTKRRINILLGSWNIDKHLDWLTKNPQKRPLENKNDRISASQLYSNGDFCEASNHHRFVEVKYKCQRTKDKTASHALTMYLIEPQQCEYILTVESPWLCSYIDSLDLNGLQTMQQPPKQQQQQNHPSTKPSPDRHDVP